MVLLDCAIVIENIENEDFYLIHTVVDVYLV